MENIKENLKKYKYWIMAVLALIALASYIISDPYARARIANLSYTDEEYQKKVEAYMLEYSIPIEEEKAQSEWRAYRHKQQLQEQERLQDPAVSPSNAQENQTDTPIPTDTKPRINE